MPILPEGKKRPWINDVKKRDVEHDPFYDSASWRRLRKQILINEPLCRACRSKGVIKPATVVDHIIRRKKRPDLSLDVSNLQPLCNSCHAVKSAREVKDK